MAVKTGWGEKIADVLASKSGGFIRNCSEEVSHRNIQTGLAMARNWDILWSPNSYKKSASYGALHSRALRYQTTCQDFGNKKHVKQKHKKIMADTTVLLSFLLCPILFAPIHFGSRRCSTIPHTHCPPLCQSNHGKPLAASGLVAFGLVAFGLVVSGSAGSGSAASRLVAF